MKEETVAFVIAGIKRLAVMLGAVFAHAGDVIFLACGVLFLSVGMFLIYMPAGWITLGVCCLATAFIIGRAQAQDDEKAERR